MYGLADVNGKKFKPEGSETYLTTASKLRSHCPGNSSFNICTVEHNEGSIAAKFHGYFLHSTGRLAQ